MNKENHTSNRLEEIVVAARIEAENRWAGAVIQKTPGRDRTPLMWVNLGQSNGFVLGAQWSVSSGHSVTPQGLISQVRSFRAGLNNDSYTDVALARELESVLERLRIYEITLEALSVKPIWQETLENSESEPED